MAKFDFVGDAYRSRSVNMNDQQTINLFPEADPTGKSVLGLYGTPGSVREFTLAAAASVRGAFEYADIAYWVSGNKFYSQTAADVINEEGTLTTNSGYVSMATNGLVILIVDGTDGYTFDLATSTFTTIADPDFPPNPLRCDLLDNTFIVIEGGSQRFWISVDGVVWDGADFASAETSPDNLTSLIVDHQELLLGGEETLEVWFNSGDATFTFSRRSTIETGVAGAGGMCKADNSVFFLGNDKVIWRLNGYTPTRVSTHAIEFAINQYDTIEDVLMWSQKEEGHVFIWCQFPSGDETWVYDVASSMWHRRAWRDPDTGDLHRHRANCYVFFDDRHLIGDFEDGRVYNLDLDAYDDDGDELAAIRVCRHIVTGDLTRNRHYSLQIDIEAGVGTVDVPDPQMMLKWSNDGGHTFSPEIWRSMGMGATGQYKKRAKWNRIGSARDRIYWAEITDPVKRVIIGAVLNAQPGIS